jgi:hypothetical protein
VAMRVEKYSRFTFTVNHCGLIRKQCITRIWIDPYTGT